MTEIKVEGGLSIKERDIAEGGEVFDINNVKIGNYASEEEDKREEEECTEALRNYLKLECLDFGKSYEGDEPFSHIAKKMQNLLPNGNIKKRILREGYGLNPEESSNVNIHYNAYVEYEAQPFDSTYARKKPFSFIIGQGNVIEGLDTAVLSMKLNEKSQFLIDPDLAYRSGCFGRIAADAKVLFEIELCEVQQSTGQNAPECNEKKFQVVYPKCLALCVKGKGMFKLKDYQGAIKVYTEATHKLEDAILNDYDDQMKSEELLVRLYTNLLVCCTRAQIPKRGCVCAQKIHEMAKNNTFKVSAKVYFNHAKCLRMVGGFDHARRRLIQAQRLEPNDPEIKQEFATLQKAKDDYRKHEKSLGMALVR